VRHIYLFQDLDLVSDGTKMLYLPHPCMCVGCWGFSRLNLN